MALNNHYEMPVPPGSPDSLIIQMSGITKVFRTPAGDTTVLKGIDVYVSQGQFVSVVGRSGSGKSTLVNMLTGIDHPTSGSVEVGGLPIHNMPESRMAVWRGKNLGIVFQFYQLLPMLTLVENVMLPMDFCNIYPTSSREERAHNLLKRVGLGEMAHKLPGAVSGGQQQSAAVARALANDPPILIADEPTGNLDSRTANDVMDLFEELIEQGKTILMVTHDHMLAMRTSRTLLISDGELVNEAISTAFPDFAHSTLLHLSHVAQTLHLPPRSPLPDFDQIPIYLVTDGSMLFSTTDGHQPIMPGGYFSPVGRNKRDITSGDNGADLLTLPPEEILPLLSPSDPIVKKWQSISPNKLHRRFRSWLNNQRRHP